MKDYVILGCDESLISLIEIIKAQGNRLKKIVGQHSAISPLLPKNSSISIESWETFIPQADEVYVCGLLGRKGMTWQKELKNKIDISCHPLIHLSSIISLTAQLSPSCTIEAGAILASNVIIGENCFIGQGAIFGHDTVLENYVIVQSGAKLAGHIRVGEGAIIGMGATIIEDLYIGNYAKVEAGAVVLKDIPPHTVVSGVPAVFKKVIG